MRTTTLAIFLVLSSGTGADAATWVVDQGGGGHFVTIQEAITAAAPGDEIVVHPGTYDERIDFDGKDLWIHSSAGATGTVIDAGELGSCAVFDNGETLDAELEGFTLRRGAGTYYEGFTRGGAVFCRGAHCTLRDCIVSENEAHNGGGLHVMGGGADVFACVFRDNVCHRYGGAIAASDGFLNLDGCLIEDNYSSYAVGGVSYAQNCSGEIRDTVFRGNRSPWVGGLNLGQPTSTVTVRGCVFDGNESTTATEGGGIRVYGGALVIEECLIVGNRCAGHGGGLAGYEGATVSVSACTFHGNGAATGGNIWFACSGTYGVANTILCGAPEGGGLAAEVVTVDCCDAWFNSGGNYRGIPDPTGFDGNISLDPLFCGVGAGDFTLRSDSPCGPEYNPSCGLIGALDVGCTPSTPAQRVTWGQVKSMFGR